MKNSGEPKATIIPTLRYKNARAMIDWLESAFGFQEHLVIPSENDNIAHAQLTLGNGMIMLGSSVDDEFGRLQQPPGSLTGPVFQNPYIVVVDIEKHYKRASAATTHGQTVLTDRNSLLLQRMSGCFWPEAAIKINKNKRKSVD